MYVVETHAVLDVYEAGELTVVGFGGRKLERELSLVAVREQIFELVDLHNCRKLALDLTGVAQLPSGLLGIVATLRDRGVDVLIYNPSDDVRNVMQTVNLDRCVQLCEVAV